MATYIIVHYEGPIEGTIDKGNLYFYSIVYTPWYVSLHLLLKLRMLFHTYFVSYRVNISLINIIYIPHFILQITSILFLILYIGSKFI